MEELGIVTTMSIVFLVFGFFMYNTINNLNNIGLHPSEWVCTETVMRGKSPKQYEDCVQYTYKTQAITTKLGVSNGK